MQAMSSILTIALLLVAPLLNAADQPRVAIQFLGLPQSSHETATKLAQLTKEIGGKVEVTILPSAFDGNGEYANMNTFLGAVKNASGLDLRITAALFLHRPAHSINWAVFGPGGSANQRQAQLSNAGFLHELDTFAAFIHMAERVRVTGVAAFHYGYIPVLEQDYVANLAAHYPAFIATMNSYLASKGVFASVRTSGAEGDVRVAGSPREGHGHVPDASLGNLDYWSNDGDVNYDHSNNTVMNLSGKQFAAAIATSWNNHKQIVPAYWHFDMNGTFNRSQKENKTAAMRGTLTPFDRNPGLYGEIKAALCGSRKAMNSNCTVP